jgi:hypothetical protein
MDPVEDLWRLWSQLTNRILAGEILSPAQEQARNEVSEMLRLHLLDPVQLYVQRIEQLQQLNEQQQAQIQTLTASGSQCILVSNYSLVVGAALAKIYYMFGLISTVIVLVVCSCCRQRKQQA